MSTCKNIIRDKNCLTIKFCNHPKCVSDFLKHMKKVVSQGYNEIIIRDEAPRFFPNACVPMAGIIDYFRKEGIQFVFDVKQDSYIHKCGLVAPYIKDRDELKKEFHPFDKIYQYETSGQVAELTQRYIDSISHQSLCEEGVLNGLTWCISEVMDNVLVHNQDMFGLVMAQYHPKTKHVAFCIYDYGDGIYKTMKQSIHKHKLGSEIDAISLAIQEGIGDGKGQGNGLYGLFQIVRENGGSLTITSGASSLILRNDGVIQKFEYVPMISSKNSGTIVDFQLDLNKSIDITKIFNSIGGFDGFDFRIDNMINESNCLVYDIFENSQGTATREAGEYIRIDIENILRRNPMLTILDFKNVKTVSSSFIDELLAKMVIDLGFSQFCSIIRLANMTQEIAYLCNRSLYMRIHDVWQMRQTV